MSTHINWLSQQPRGDRLVVPVLGTIRHTDASLSGTASKQARTAVLPLCKALLSGHAVPSSQRAAPPVTGQGGGATETNLVPQLGDDAAAVLDGRQVLGLAGEH